MEEYRGARDVDSLKEFVIVMKAKAAVAVDVGNEGVPDERSPEQDDDEEQDENEDEDEAAAAGQVVLCSV